MLFEFYLCIQLTQQLLFYGNNKMNTTLDTWHDKKEVCAVKVPIKCRECTFELDNANVKYLLSFNCYVETEEM